MTLAQVESIEAAATALSGCRFLDAEFMYKPRPQAGREQIVFDWTLHSRLSKFDSTDGVLLISDSQQTIDSLAQIAALFPKPRIAAAITNPVKWTGKSSDTPTLCGWGEGWQQYQTTDRWVRIKYALQIGSLMNHRGYLIMPAHDAVWGKTLLDRLVHFSQRHARKGLPAAVSPYTYYQHSPVPKADIPQDVVDLLNVAFGRDSLFHWKIHLNQVQQFWGKMSLIPFGMCSAIRDHIEPSTFEDDLVIDRVIGEQGYRARCLWVNNPDIYRQALPVFDREGVRQVIERTLHYSLNIPGEPGGLLNAPLDWIGRIRRLVDPRFARLNAEVEALVAECTATITQRVKQYGLSWVDWGAYRYVARVGDPAVEVWKQDGTPYPPHARV